MKGIARRRLPELRDLTHARVALSTAGNTLATTEVLAFQLSHALARDSVHASLDFDSLERQMTEALPLLRERGIGTVRLRSNAADRSSYLRYPHLGRTLHEDSAAQLKPVPCDLSIVVADGLSSRAVERHLIPLLGHLLPLLFEPAWPDRAWSLAPIALVEQGRVAIGDPIGAALGARCSLVLLGERPGLSCADSLGAYLTWSPHPSRTDAERNCVSNIHDAGLRPEVAAGRLLRLMEGARALGCTGTALKDDSDPPLPAEVH